MNPLQTAYKGADRIRTGVCSLSLSTSGIAPHYMKEDGRG